MYFHYYLFICHILTHSRHTQEIFLLDAGYSNSVCVFLSVRVSSKEFGIKSVKLKPDRTDGHLGLQVNNMRCYKLEGVLLEFNAENHLTNNLINIQRRGKKK